MKKSSALLGSFLLGLALLPVSSSVSAAPVKKQKPTLELAALDEQVLSGEEMASESEAVPSMEPEPVSVPKESGDEKQRLTARMKRLIASSGFKAGQLGLWVGAKGGRGQETVFEQNGTQLLIPASLSKLVTAGAILHGLHPSYKYKTQLMSDASVGATGVLNGSLYLKGGGDPSFVSENMWFLVNELTRTGIVSVDGDIIVDDSRFDGVRIGQDRESVRVDRAYDAPLGAMSMNWNSVSVYIRPGAKAGEPARVVMDPDTPYLRLVNDAKTVAGSGKGVGVERTSQKGFDGDVIRVSGKIGAGAGEVVFYKSITHPDLWSGYNLVAFLKQRGITVRGQVKRGTAPAKAQALATAESKPLALVVADMSKWSNNYVAEMLVKNLAAEAGVVPATMPAGMAQLEKYLASIGFKKGEYKFVNASGFSRENRLSSAQLGRVLEAMREDFTSYPEYLTSLPIGGVDGTLRSRMKRSAAERWVRAKTGLLNGVVGLAGYAGRPDGTVRTFSFIYNGSGREDQARALFDRLAAALVED